MRSGAEVGVGIALVVLGAAHIVPGAVLIASDTSSSGDLFSGLGRFSGGMLVGFGVAHVIPGVVLIGVGASTVEAGPVTFNVGPTSAGATLHF